MWGERRGSPTAHTKSCHRAKDGIVPGNEDIGEVGKSALKEFDGDIVDWEKPYGF